MNARQPFKHLIRQGAFSQAYQYAHSLPPEITHQPDFQLEWCRAHLRQGDLLPAEEKLNLLLAQNTAADEQILARLEQAYLQILRQGHFRESLHRADEIMKTDLPPDASSALRAEAERVHIRILLTAATYYEISREEAAEARDRLPEIAQRLEQAGQSDTAFSALLLYAQRLPWPAMAQALKRIAASATEQGFYDVAGEATLILADNHLKNGSPSPTVEEWLRQSRAYYQMMDHRYGTIEVDVLSAKLHTKHATELEAELHECLTAFEARNYYRGVLNVLMDLSGLAHQQGATDRAANYRDQTLQWSEKLGMGIIVQSFLTAQIDLCMRNADFGEAIDLCQLALSRELSPMSYALFEQLLASAYTFTRNLEAATRHGRSAVRQFEQMGADDAASDAVLKYAADLSALRTDNAWTEADVLLQSWIQKDHQRGDVDAEVAKLEMTAQICIQQFLYSREHQGDPSLLSKGEAIIDRAEMAARSLPMPESAKRRANLLQLRGQFFQSRQDEAQVAKCWEKALDLYTEVGLQMEMANSKYILGTIYLNRANGQLMPNFGVSEGYLQEALQYYEQVNMRSQANDARYMLAFLYKNAALRVQVPLRDHLLDRALELLQLADEDAHLIRSGFRSGASSLEIQQAKKALSAHGHRIHQLALEIVTLIRPNPKLAWEWTQKTKARSLADLLGLGVEVPLDIQEDPAAMAAMQQMQQLSRKLDQVEATERASLRLELQQLQARMLQHPLLADYLELQQGMALDLDTMYALLAPDNGPFPAQVYVDWLALGDHLFLLTVRSNEMPHLHRLSISLSTVADFVRFDLSPESFRSNLKYIPGLLDRLHPLIAPLAQLTQPEELLILCPTGPLHRLPIHALQLEGKILLERNPVIYAPGSMVYRHCLHRKAATDTLRTAALFGDPLGDRPQAEAIVRQLAQQFNTSAQLKEQVTKSAFLKAIQQVDLLHFQGHALHDPVDPLNSHLVLADATLSAREIFEKVQLQATLVSLAACETATSHIDAGDEPLGLIPAFLQAGAGAILATLWKVHEGAAALCIQIFFNKLMASNGSTKVQALREAILEVRQTKGFESPYFWAAFTLHGSWK